VFDLSLPKLLVLAVIALVVFGPDELPKIAAQAGRALRDLRQIAESANNDLREGLGPEFTGFDIEDLNPKRLVHEHLFGVDRPGIFGGPCLPDTINLPCLLGVRNSFPHILSAAHTRMPSGAVPCCTRRPIPGSRA